MRQKIKMTKTHMKRKNTRKEKVTKQDKIKKRKII